MSLRNKTLDNMESAEMQDEARSRGWDIQHLTFSDYSVDATDLSRWHAITDGHMECGDASDGIVIFEIKTLADSMDEDRIREQMHKMSWTGLKVAIIVRGIHESYKDLKYKAKKSDETISYHLNRWRGMTARLGIPVFPTTDVNDTFNMMEYWFKNHDKVPKPLDTFYLYKPDVDIMTDIKIIACVPGIGVKRARAIVKKAGSAGKVIRDAIQMELEDFQANYRDTEGWGDKTCKILWEALQ